MHRVVHGPTASGEANEQNRRNPQEAKGGRPRDVLCLGSTLRCLLRIVFRAREVAHMELGGVLTEWAGWAHLIQGGVDWWWCGVVW